ncbi:hypothetical protein [Streptomyces sp. SAS_276]|uniref:hypothetical protein n=1 Tax=Streptomyces sp. SAS_276 TaxID=3412745 RepID=UPI00403C10A4
MGSFFSGGISLRGRAKASSSASITTYLRRRAKVVIRVRWRNRSALGLEKSMTYTRADACIHDDLNVIHYDDGDPDGLAIFDYRNAINTDVGSDTFTQRTTIQLDSMSGVMTE